VPSITYPIFGGVVSTIKPSDEADEHKSAVLHAVIVIKYFIPSARCKYFTSVSENKRK
jgi:hypothetical protein